MSRYRLWFSMLAVAFGWGTLSAVSVSAATINAASCSQANMQSAVNSASSGDTVIVPAGTCPWNGSVTINKALKLQGAGVGTTVINNTLNSQYGYALVEYGPTATEAPKVFEMSGFTLNGASIGGCFGASAPSSTTPITGLKIHDNNFINGRTRGIILSGMEFGVFYNNTFSGHYIAIQSIGAGDAGWNYSHVLGSANYPYFEDNTFGDGAGAFLAESGQGGRYVFRHNTVSGYACSGCEVFDVHGNQGDRGTVSSEFYRNSLNVGSSGTYRWMNHRGGQTIIANNTLNRSIGFNITEYRSWGGNGVCESYPAQDQISNSFYWNNTNSPSLYCTDSSCSSCSGTNDTTHLQLNRDYWLPMSGTEANRPGTCAVNTYYGTTDTDKIYKCTSANTWTLFYQPYTYPHPLRSDGAPDTEPPTSPTNLAATSPSQSSISVSWTASTDPAVAGQATSGVTGYHIERCQGTSCSNFAQVGTPTSSPFVDSGLTANTFYNYHVRATDAAGNLSGWSNVVGATTQAPDTQAPTAPSNLQASVVSSSTINLTWTASTDNIAVTGYKVERCSGSGCTNFTQVGTPSSNSYSDTSLASSTLYRYQVRATDGGGNNSSYSNIASATTTSAPITMGETNILGTGDSGNGNLLLAQQATLSQGGILQSLSFYVTTAAGNLRLGVYDATGPSGGPGALKAQTNSFTPTTGWNTQNVTTPIALTSGTYWLAYLPSSSSLAFVRDGTGSFKYYSYTFGALPTTFSPSPSSGTDHWSFYATLTSGTSSPQSCSTIQTPTDWNAMNNTGYGTPYDLFDSNNLILKADCTAGTPTTMNLSIGKNNDNQLFSYMGGYYWNGTNWTSYTLSNCNGTQSGSWCLGTSTGTLTNTSINTTTKTTPQFFLGFTCRYTGSLPWKCGCHDSTCSTPYWQVQGAGL